MESSVAIRDLCAMPTDPPSRLPGRPIHAPPVRRAWLAVNPASGQSGPTEPERLASLLAGLLTPLGATLHVHTTARGDDLSQRVRDAIHAGFDTAIAAGGDGTVSAVANGLIGTRGRLGIVPVGTSNVLARELNIPLDPDAACRVIAAPVPTILPIDAMRIGDHHYVTQVGVGIDALMIRDTTPREKRRFGRLAYAVAGARALVGFAPRRFTLLIDDQTYQPRSTQIVLANCGAMGMPGFRWAPAARADDGRIDVCILHPRNLLGYLGVAWAFLTRNHNRLPWDLNTRTARRLVSIATENPSNPLPVQADGEIVAHTPVEVRIVPHALPVLVPHAD
jgi:YegS/Rv2252/BmrU family lipid kinase